MAEPIYILEQRGCKLLLWVYKLLDMLNRACLVDGSYQSRIFVSNHSDRNRDQLLVEEPSDDVCLCPDQIDLVEEGKFGRLARIWV